MSPISTMERIELRANALQFEGFRHGPESPGTRRALLLHGFPDDPRSMHPLMERLAEMGFESFAPWMRGYGPTQTPSDGDYHLATLASDAIGLLDALDWGRAWLIGHDWGALTGYAAANLAPHRLSHLVAMSVPPPRIFLRNLVRHPVQLRRSWYIAFFQFADWPERWLSRHDFETIEELWTDSLRDVGAYDDHLRRVRETFRHDQTLESALGYYRALLPRSFETSRTYRRSLELSLRSISRPTLMIAGDRDRAVGAEMFESPETAFDAPHDLLVLFGAGHFIQLEAPDEIAQAVSTFGDVS